MPAGMRACCGRCGTTIRARFSSGPHRNRTAAIAVAALILYPLAVTLPIIEVEKFGHLHASSVLGGVSTLLSRGHLVVGVVVPVMKLLALLALSTDRGLGQPHRALTYRLVEWTGRWGMLDVLLVAILVAVLKLGDLMTVNVGPGLLAFTVCVTLSLAAAASFDPFGMWESQS